MLNNTAIVLKASVESLNSILTYASKVDTRYSEYFRQLPKSDKPNCLGEVGGCLNAYLRQLSDLELVKPEAVKISDGAQFVKSANDPVVVKVVPEAETTYLYLAYKGLQTERPVFAKYAKLPKSIPKDVAAAGCVNNFAIESVLRLPDSNALFL